jgi:hypothetical protein
MAHAPHYQPLLAERNVRRLYRLKVWFREHHGQRMPMTVLLNRIVDDFFAASEDDALAAPASAPSHRTSSAFSRNP